MAQWRWYLATHRAQLGGGPGLFDALLRRGGFDPEARRALRAHHEARLVAMNATAKLATIEDLLRRHANDKVIIFTEYVDMVDAISRALLLPSITYRTPAAERRAILEGFRSSTFTKLVTGRVLNEGVDVPDANVAIVASGSSSMREYVQRLGRVLRPKATEAQLYELISRRTTERNAARRRRPKRKGLPDAPDLAELDPCKTQKAAESATPLIPPHCTRAAAAPRFPAKTANPSPTDEHHPTCVGARHVAPCPHPSASGPPQPQKSARSADNAATMHQQRRTAVGVGLPRPPHPTPPVTAHATTRKTARSARSSRPAAGCAARGHPGAASAAGHDPHPPKTRQKRQCPSQPHRRISQTRQEWQYRTRSQMLTDLSSALCHLCVLSGEIICIS